MICTSHVNTARPRIRDCPTRSTGQSESYARLDHRDQLEGDMSQKERINLYKPVGESTEDGRVWAMVLDLEADEIVWHVELFVNSIIGTSAYTP